MLNRSVTAQPDKLAASIVSGVGLVCSLSTASVLQSLYPYVIADNLRWPAVLGLLTGWVFSHPIAVLMARCAASWSPGRVSAVVAAIGVLAALPLYLCGAAIGAQTQNPVLLALGGLLGFTGLVWGGFFPLDTLAERPFEPGE
ncbi:MAG: hypothetical protein ACREIA_21750 [Opitutaceae bacterium]